MKRTHDRDDDPSKRSRGVVGYNAGGAGGAAAAANPYAAYAAANPAAAAYMYDYSGATAAAHDPAAYAAYYGGAYAAMQPQQAAAAMNPYGAMAAQYGAAAGGNAVAGQYGGAQQMYAAARGMGGMGGMGGHMGGGGMGGGHMGQQGGMMGQQQQQQGGGQPNRTVYLGGLSPDSTLEDVCNIVRGGQLEQVRIMAERSCAFITFVDINAAVSFYQYAASTPLNLKGRSLKVGWGKANVLHNEIYQAVQNGATRALGIANAPSINKAHLLTDFARFGPIESVRASPEYGSATVYFANIKAAMQAMASLPQEPNWSHCNFTYEQDRCGASAIGIPPNNGGGQQQQQWQNRGGMQQQQQQRMGGVGRGGMGGQQMGGGFNNNRMGGQQQGGFQQQQQKPQTANPGVQGEPGRTIYIGNLPRGSPAAPIIDHIRGGSLEEIRLLNDKCCAFITFISESAATTFHDNAQKNPIIIGGRTCKVGWGRSNPSSEEVQEAVAAGATRVMYLAGLDPSVTEAHLRQNLGKYGGIESVQLIPDQGAAYISFMSVSGSLAALTACASDPMAEHYKLGYGPDRCGGSIATAASSHIPFVARAKAAAAAGNDAGNAAKESTEGEEQGGEESNNGNGDSNNNGGEGSNEANDGDKAAGEEKGDDDAYGL